MFPVLDEQLQAVYCQVRYTEPDEDHRYDNPAEKAFRGKPHAWPTSSTGRALAKRWI